MSNTNGYFTSVPERDQNRPPGSVKATRVLLYILGGIAVLGTVLGFAVTRDPEALGQVVGIELPGLVALVLAILIKPGRVAVRWIIIVVAAIDVILGFSVLVTGDPRGITQVGIPIAILVLVNQRTAREFFARPR